MATKKQAEERFIIIYDETAYTGRTLKEVWENLTEDVGAVAVHDCEFYRGGKIEVVVSVVQVQEVKEI